MQKLFNMSTPYVDVRVLLLPVSDDINDDSISEHNGSITMQEPNFVIDSSKGTCPDHDLLHNEMFKKCLSFMKVMTIMSYHVH